MSQLGLSISSWAQRADLPESTLRTFLNSVTRNMRSDTEARLARAAGFRSADHMYGIDYGPALAHQRVWVKGYAESGNSVSLFEALGEREGYYEVARPPSTDPDLPLVAVELRGGALAPFRDGDVIYCEQRRGVDDDVIGQPCLVVTASDEPLLREVRRGYELGRYNLIGWHGEPLRENVELARAMPIISVVRKDRASL